MGTALTDTLDISDDIEIPAPQINPAPETIETAEADARPSRGWRRMREIRRSDLA
jgi:hypothetical protein